MIATVTFREIIQDSQDYGSDDEHMVSRVFFDLEIEGRVYPNLHADLKQTVGDSFESGSIEVGRPVGYSGPFNHVAFSDAVDTYYRSAVGSSGAGIRIEGGSNVRMRNNRFVVPKVVTFDVSRGAG